MVGNIGALFVWLFRFGFLGAMVASGGLLFGSFQHCSPFSSWQKVPLVSSTASICDRNGLYGICVDYAYRVDGKVFYGDRLTCLESGYSELSQAEAKLREIRSAIRYASVRSDNKAISVIDFDIPFGAYLMPFLAALLWWIFERWIRLWILARLNCCNPPNAYS